VNRTNEIYYQEREAEIYDLSNQWKTDDVDYWLGLGREFAKGRTALELGCGTGRILFPMAESGINVVGVDQSPWMLAKAKEKYDRLEGGMQERIGLLEADMRTLQLETRFNLIYIPFNTFLIMRTPADQLAVFEVARRHLAPGGVFAFDVFIPDIKRLAQTQRPPAWGLEVDQTIGDLGIRLHRETISRYDTINQQMSVTFKMREFRDNVLQREWLSDLQMCYIWPRELEHLVERGGFEFVAFYGEYDRRDFRKPVPTKMLPVLRPR
jgi:ubiquinone/menaquinone biosynthesis C-methylase UbiE